MFLIGISGGIGSGKSVVSEILRTMGYAVYDCDSRAKMLMVRDTQVRDALRNLFGNEVYLENGEINKSFLASRIFANEAMRDKVNGVVHPAVRRDLSQWVETLCQSGSLVAFVESAIMVESGLAAMMDGIIFVDAPLHVRVSRAMKRDSTSEDAVMARVLAQKDKENTNKSVASWVIDNGGSSAVLAQINDILLSLSKRIL